MAKRSVIKWATNRPGDASPFAMGLLLRRAHLRAAGELAAAVRPFGLELRHFAMLIVLADRGPTLQRDLVAATGFDKAAVGRAIDDLETAGLVTREGVEGDRRVWMVQITEDGLEVFEEVHCEAQSIADMLIAHLKPGEPEQLMRLLTRFTYPES
ncbi:MarR family winged helix-turn-helix transcriptional regulator [Mycolicibacterium chlorophenolicum]|uniref:MarR family winged helix-turn-helix transcriptional regulator n=1 Tax=Mycolicibacterium chlorophenolicum TaxID=37916 RepID=UPI00191C30A7|nr:MarR family winged helix-turn-helix transcriptional regulator [Mycolicibacterium chlorophenolicum]